jgi:MarR family transcriptional regulator, organic hydroperoxide resistance regulator
VWPPTRRTSLARYAGARASAAPALRRCLGRHAPSSDERRRRWSRKAEIDHAPSRDCRGTWTKVRLASAAGTSRLGTSARRPAAGERAPPQGAARVGAAAYVCGRLRRPAPVPSPLRREPPPSLPANLGPVLEFMHALWALDHALSVRDREIGERFGVTGLQRLVVRIVGQRPGATAGDVARILRVHPSTLTPVLHVLATSRLLSRAPDPADRRRAVLRLTARGGRLDSQSAALVDRDVRKALAQLNASQVLAARCVLHAVAAALRGDSPARALGADLGRTRRRAPAPLRATPPRAAAAPSATPAAERASAPGASRRRAEKPGTVGAERGTAPVRAGSRA